MTGSLFCSHLFAYIGHVVAVVVGMHVCVLFNSIIYLELHKNLTIFIEFDVSFTTHIFFITPIRSFLSLFSSILLSLIARCCFFLHVPNKNESLSVLFVLMLLLLHTNNSIYYCYFFLFHSIFAVARCGSSYCGIRRFEKY